MNFYFIFTFRPSFYNSEETNAQQEALLCQAEEPSNDKEYTVAPQTPSHISVSAPEEPVCYSVEAVLGRQMFKPLCNSFTTPHSQEFTPPCVEKTSTCTLESSSQSEVPYSVDAVLRSCKSEDNGPFGHTLTPPAAQIVSYTPKPGREKLVGHLLSPETQKEKVLSSINTRNEANKSYEKMFKSSSHQLHSGLISKTCPDYPVVSGDHNKKQGEMLTSAQRVSQQVKLELHSSATVPDRSESSKNKGDLKGSNQLPTYTTSSVNCKNEGLCPFGPSELKSLTSTPKHPAKLKPHISRQKGNLEVSVQPLCPPSGSEFKGRAAVSAEPGTSFTNNGYFTAKQPTEVQQHLKKTQAGLKLASQQQYLDETTADCSSKRAHCDKTQKIQFRSLFARPITESLNPTTPAAHQGFVQSSCLGLQSALCTSKHTNSAVKTDKPLTKSFLSLFAAPLSAAPLQSLQTQPDHSRTNSCSQESHQSADHTCHSLDPSPEAPLPHQVKTDDEQSLRRPASPKMSTSLKKANEEKPVTEPSEQQVNPACSSVSDSLSDMSSSPDLSTVHQQEPSILSPKGTNTPQCLTHAGLKSSFVLDLLKIFVNACLVGSANAADSVLKTLFVCLSPYQQGGEQQEVQSVPSGTLFTDSCD